MTQFAPYHLFDFPLQKELDQMRKKLSETEMKNARVTHDVCGVLVDSLGGDSHL